MVEVFIFSTDISYDFVGPGVGYVHIEGDCDRFCSVHYPLQLFAADHISFLLPYINGSC